METDSPQSEESTDRVGNADQVARRLLVPHNTLRNIHNRRTLLVLAAEGCLNLPIDLKTFTEGDPAVNVRYTSKLPLPDNDKLPPIDVIALVCKVFNEDSLEAVEKFIPFIDVRYFASKCFVLATSDTEFRDEDTKNIEKFANAYSLPIHYTVKTKPMEKGDVARLKIPHRLMSIYCPPAGCGVTTSTLLADMSLSYLFN